MALAWAMLQYSRWCQMKLHRVRQASEAAGDRLPLPQPILAAVATTMAWEATNNGHDVDLAVGEWLGAHGPPVAQGTCAKFMGLGERQKMQSRPRRHRLATSRGVQSLQDGGARRDRHHGQCCSGACSSSASCTASLLEPPPVLWGNKCLTCRAVSATLHQGRSCRSRNECVFGASAAFRQTQRGRPTRRLASIAATLAASSTSS